MSKASAVPKLIDLHGVVDDQVGGHERIGAAGVGAHGGKGVAHGGEIDHAGHAGEVLQQDAGGHEADFLVAGLATPRATYSMSAAETRLPSSQRSRFSSRIVVETGRLEGSPMPDSWRRARRK